VAGRHRAGQGRAEAVALGGTAAARRMQLERAIDRIAPELGLEDGDAEDPADA
jgi:hypothetical protein